MTKMTEQDKQDYREDEFKQEQEQDLRAREILDYKEQNETKLINDFVEMNKQDFEIFLKNEIIDETYNIDYWKKVFCEEEFEYAFEEYVNKCYRESD